MKLQKVISGYISSQHGGAVAEQFDETFNDTSNFSNQNYNALVYIFDSIEQLLLEDLFSDSTREKLEVYSNELNDYFTLG